LAGLSPTEHTSFILDTLPFGGFSPVRFQGQYFRRAFLSTTSSSRRAVCIRPSCTSLPVSPNPRSMSRGAVRWCTTVQAANAALPQGSSLQSGLCCPGPSSLNRPHAPHSPAQPDFAAQRFIRAALAVSLRTSATSEWFRAFANHSLSACRPPRPREVHRLPIPSSFTDDAGLEPSTKVSALPISPPSASCGANDFGASLRLAFACDLSICSPSCRSGLGLRLAHEDFYSRASDGLVTRTVAGYSYRDNWASFPGGSFIRKNSSWLRCNEDSIGQCRHRG
jgi:hypothetical protein